MDPIRRAEILVYLLLSAPKDLLFSGAQDALKQWCVRELLIRAPNFGEQDALDVAGHFVSFVPRLQRDLGMVAGGPTSINFSLQPDFLNFQELRSSLFIERDQLLARLARLNELLEFSSSFPLDNVVGRESNTRDLDRQRLPTASLYSDLTSFLAQPGFDALDQETLQRLLARDTGA